MTTRHHLCLLSPLPRRTSGSWQEKEAKREQDSYKGPFTKVWARGRGSQRGGEGPKRVHRAGAAGLGPQGEDRRERAGLCPAVRELGKFPNLWAEVQTHPEARGEWGDGATDDAVAGGGWANQEYPAHSSAATSSLPEPRVDTHWTVPLPPVLYFSHPLPLASLGAGSSLKSSSEQVSGGIECPLGVTLSLG